jgi:hypothetical protein
MRPVCPSFAILAMDLQHRASGRRGSAGRAEPRVIERVPHTRTWYLANTKKAKAADAIGSISPLAESAALSALCRIDLNFMLPTMKSRRFPPAPISRHIFEY